MENRALGTDGTRLRTTERAEGTTSRLAGPNAEGLGDTGTGHTLSTEDLVKAEPVTTTEAATAAEPAAAEPHDDGENTLFDDTDVERFRGSWQGIQTAFVDDPQRAVKEADELVAVVIQTLAATFADHKNELESAWSQGAPVNQLLRA